MVQRPGWWATEKFPDFESQVRIYVSARAVVTTLSFPPDTGTFCDFRAFCSDSVGGLHMKKVEEYLGHAAECREMAQSAPPQHRQQLEEMAKTWEQLAEARQCELNKRSKLQLNP